MEIKEAISQIKQVSLSLEAFKEVEDILNIALTSHESINEMENKLVGLESDIAAKKKELSAKKEQYVELSNQLAENYEKAKISSNEALKNLKKTVSKEYDEAKISSDAKIAELNNVIRDLEVKANDLKRFVIEKEELLNDLNRDIEIIRAKVK